MRKITTDSLNWFWEKGIKPIKEKVENLKNTMDTMLKISEIVNNCVTDNPDLPLAAAQGKFLMDQITGLYSGIAMINNVVFPDTRSWLSDQWNLIKDAAMNVSVVKNSSQAKITAESTPGIGSNLAAHLRSPLIDLTYFNALTISGKAYVKENHRTDNYLSPKVFLMNSLGNKVKTLYVYPEQTTGDKTINVTYDISDIEGRCSIDLELMIYAWADAVFGVGNYVSLTGCELSR